MAKYAKTSQWTTLRVAVAWTATRGAREWRVDDRVPRLLAEVARAGTLIGAARNAGIAYRTAWAMLEEATQAIGAPLVELQRGRGAALSPLGQQLLFAHEAAVEATAAFAPLEVKEQVPPRPRADSPATLRIAASHDIALAQLRDRWRLAHGIELAFHGSAESLDTYRAGKVDAAGFHVEQPARRDDPLLTRLDATRDALISFITRTQGLILPKGNPRRVGTLGQAVARGLAIVNRQPGSGTRLLLDRLLAREGVDRSRVRGYSQEEFTHAAVAATVAAGRADLGLGIQAAAAQFGLAFVPLVVERYCFAVRRRSLRSPRIAAFRELLASEATRAVVAPLPGYTLDHPGEVV